MGAVYFICFACAHGGLSRNTQVAKKVEGTIASQQIWYVDFLSIEKCQTLMSIKRTKALQLFSSNNEGYV